MSAAMTPAAGGSKRSRLGPTVSGPRHRRAAGVPWLVRYTLAVLAVLVGSASAQAQQVRVALMP